MMMVMTNERSDITSTDVLGKIIDNLISMQGFLERKKKIQDYSCKCNIMQTLNGKTFRRADQHPLYENQNQNDDAWLSGPGLSVILSLVRRVRARSDAAQQQ
jgi:hypothetical protein